MVLFVRSCPQDLKTTNIGVFQIALSLSGRHVIRFPISDRQVGETVAVKVVGGSQRTFKNHSAFIRGGELKWVAASGIEKWRNEFAEVFARVETRV